MRPGTTLLLVLSLLAAPAALAEMDPSVVHKIIDLTNAQRRAAGVPELRVSGFLQQAAQSHADDQARRNYDAHNSPEGMTPRDRMLAVGYDANTTTGENIYNGWGSNDFTSPEAAVNWWMNSPGHRANMLNPVYTEIGVGMSVAGTNAKHRYVQNFGSASLSGNGGWGAIAYSAVTGAAGQAAGKATAAEALAAAMAQCTGVAEDCVLALSYRNGCGVVKKDASGAWGAGLAGGHGMPAINAAGMQSRQRCLQSGGSTCNELVVAACSR